MAWLQRNGIKYSITVVFGLASAAACLTSFFRVEILPKMFPPSGEGKAKLTAAQEALTPDKQ